MEGFTNLPKLIIFYVLNVGVNIQRRGEIIVKCEKCRREMVQIGPFAFACPYCDSEGDNGGISLVVE